MRRTGCGIKAHIGGIAMFKPMFRTARDVKKIMERDRIVLAKFSERGIVGGKQTAAIVYFQPYIIPQPRPCVIAIRRRKCVIISNGKCLNTANPESSSAINLTSKGGWGTRSIILLCA